MMATVRGRGLAIFGEVNGVESFLPVYYRTGFWAAACAAASAS
jgi:hypothetical protein